MAAGAAGAVIAKARAMEAQASGPYTGSGRKASESSSTKKKVVLGATAVGVIIFGLIAALIVAVVGTPMIMIGAIDFNLQRMLGFDETVAILEEQGEYVSAEMFASGKVPEGYASDLAQAGLEVGQVTTAGNFVRTNEYIAGLEQDVAATGPFKATEDGELALLWHGDIIRSDEFVARVESDPELYAAYSKAADISARYYYSKDVDDAYNEMGLSRGTFNSWKATGDYDSDLEKFNTIITKMLDSKTSTNLSGWNEDCRDEDVWEYKEGDECGAREGLISKIFDWYRKVEGETVTETETTTEPDGTTTTTTTTKKEDDKYFKLEGYSKNLSGDMSEKIEKIAEDTRDAEEESEQMATRKAAELLNMALSAGEPYSAASAFMAVEEPISRARAGDGGPVNEVMNMLTLPTTVSYRDASSGEMVTSSNTSILDTGNFVAAVSNSSFSKSEAFNFSRDRILKATIDAGDEVINETLVATDGKKRSNILTIFSDGDQANNEILQGGKDDLELAYEKKNSELFQSPVGGNRIVEGGSFISNTINLRAAGAMPSDSETVFAYHREVEEVFARQAEAERATKSPFDITSPNTFFGNIVHKLAQMAIINTGAKSRNSVLSVLGTVAGTVGNSAKGIIGGTATADSEETVYTTLMGEECKTVGSAANVAGDLYCTSHNTITTKYKNLTLDDWQGELDGQIDSEGKIEEGSELEKFTILGMDRGATVGVKSSDVCERYQDFEGKKSKSSVLSVIRGFLSSWSWYDACDGTPEEVATGAFYTLSEENENLEDIEKYSGYALYSKVRSLLEEKQSATAAAKERFYAEFPKDTSREGVISRITGMSIAEATLLCDYIDTVIADL